MLGWISSGAYLFWKVATHLGGLLLAQDQPELESEDVEGAQSRLWRAHTTQREGLGRPRAYGKNLHHGNIVAKWTEVDGYYREALYLLLDHGDGPTKGVDDLTADVFLNDQPATNFTSIALQQRLGTMNQTCMTGFEKPKLECIKNTKLIYNEPVIVTTPNNFFNDIEYTLMWPDGLRKYKKSGSVRASSSHIKVQIREHPAGSWTPIFDENINGSSIEPLFKLHVVSDLWDNIDKGKQYDLEFTNLSPTKERVVNGVNLRSIREVINVPFTKPGRALVGIRAVATSQLSGNLDVKVIREDRIINTWNGTVWTLKYSNNRAWVTWDALSLPAIDGDGGGEPYEIIRYAGIDPQYLDLEFFYKWAQFCDKDILSGYGAEVEPRCPCNTIIDEFTNVFSLAHKIVKIGRANIYWEGHQLTGWIDDAVTTPIDLVTMDSMMHKTWKNGWAVEEELAGVIEVFYKDEKQGYERTSAECASGSTDGFKNPVSLEGIGITSRGVAVHYAHYLLERNHLIRNVNKFKVHKDGFRYKLGDVIRLQCRIANWGKGWRVKSSTANTITVNRDVSAEIIAGNVLYIRTYDAATKKVTVDTYEVDSVDGKVITATVNWDVTPVKGNLIATGAAGDIKLRRIVKMTPTVDNYFNVEVETYDTNLFDADDIDPHNPLLNYIWPGPGSGLTPSLTRDEIIHLVESLQTIQLDMDVPWPSNLTWSGNSVDTVSWSKTDVDDSIIFLLKGVEYEITADSTDLKYIYWDLENPTVFSSTNNLSIMIAAILAGGWSMCVNQEGVPLSAAPFQILHGGLIQAGTIIAKHLIVNGIDEDGNLNLVHIGSGNADNIDEGDSNKFAAESGADVTGGHTCDTPDVDHFSGKNQDDLPDGTTHKQYSNTEKTKLGGVETGADVTKTHEAATIFNQGNLAILNVVGGAQIDHLAVDTLHIKNNAVTVPLSVYTASPQAFRAETTIQELSFTTSGQNPYIQFCCALNSNNSLDVETITWRIYRDAEKIYETSYYVRNVGGATKLSGLVSFNFSEEETPEVGTYTYYIKALVTGLDAEAKCRSLYIHELKK